ncbi:hypothetical protein [Streptomyces sp. NPDC059009]|uniref:hypothetical protein n=1 Tax=Streptomyces sp. NPDC059009 TaxID=3346694 RepID=UPI0036C3B67A
MLLIDVYVPQGIFGEQERQALGRRLIDAVMVEDDSHAIEVLDAERRLVQVLVHEPAGWVLGQRPEADPADLPRYFVRVSVPAPWRKEVSTHLVHTLTVVLAQTEAAARRDPERLRREPHALVHIVGISEGSIGIYGRSVGAREVEEQVTRPYRDAVARGAVLQAPEGKLIDPVCGMTVGRGHAHAGAPGGRGRVLFRLLSPLLRG